MEQQEPNMDYRWLAAQLAKPSGQGSMKVAEQMATTNEGMIRQTIAGLDIGLGRQRVLEIGMGNGSHMPMVLERLVDGMYYGVDTSEDMVAEASRANKHWIERGRMVIQQNEDHILPFADAYFDQVFTVNTLYFFRSPERFVAEIFRVLKPGGKLHLAFADRSFMESLPFVQYGFKLYDIAAATMLLTSSSYATTVRKIMTNDEVVVSNTGQSVKRKYHIVIAQKKA